MASISTKEQETPPRVYRRTTSSSGSYYHSSNNVERDQLRKLSRWLQAQQPKLQNVKERVMASFETELVSTSETEFAIVQNETMEDDDSSQVLVICQEENDKNGFMTEEGKTLARKVGAAIVGGTLIVTGIPLIPLPGPGDFMVVGGFAVLATEFEGPRRVLVTARDKLEQVLHKTENEEEESNGHEETKQGGDKGDKNKEEESDDSDKTQMERDKEGATPKMDLEGATRELKRFGERMGRNVVLPLLNQVCTEKNPSSEETGSTSNETAAESDVSTKQNTLVEDKKGFAENPKTPCEEVSVTNNSNDADSTDDTPCVIFCEEEVVVHADDHSSNTESEKTVKTQEEGEEEEDWELCSEKSNPSA